MRATWGSKIGFILAAAGSAIGLGNIWRFPYLTAQNGGMAFLLVYLVCVCSLGYFILTAKLAFGRLAKTNFVDGFKKVGGKKVSSWWGKIAGPLVLFNIFAVTAVYVIVIGWTLSYVVATGKNLIGFNPIKIDKGLFDTLTASFSEQLLWILTCLVVSGLILIKGIKGGIEKVSLYLMPAFFVLLFLGALTSLIAIFEPAINLIMEKLNLSRAKATLTTLGINLFVALLVLASTTKKINFKESLFDFFDYETGTYTLSMMIMLYCIFMGWKICPKLLQSMKNNSKFFKVYFPFVLKWLAPIVLITLFISG